MTALAALRLFWNLKFLCAVLQVRVEPLVAVNSK